MTTAAAPARKINLVWVEDKPNSVKGLANTIANRNEDRVQVDVVEGGVDLQRIHEEGVSGYIFDIQLNGPDGITLAKRVRRKNKIVPIRFFSSYLKDYQKRLAEVENVAGTHDRIENSADDEKMNRFLTDVTEDAAAYHTLTSRGVLSMKWDDFLSSPFQNEIVYAHARLFTAYARNAMAKNGWAWVAYCGSEVANASPNINEFPTFEEKRELTKKNGAFAFVYTRPIVSEEGGEDRMLLNYYPKIEIKVDGKNALADFDTGTTRTLVSDALLKPEPGTIPERSVHFGREYEYFSNRRSLSFHSYGSTDEFIGPVAMPVAIVKDWHGKQSPWKIINPDREALVGRDIFGVDTIMIQLVSTDELKVFTKISKHEPTEAK